MHRRPTPLFPECTNGTSFIPFTQVLDGSSDVPSPSGAPAVEPYPALRKLLKDTTSV